MHRLVIEASHPRIEIVVWSKSGRPVGQLLQLLAGVVAVNIIQWCHWKASLLTFQQCISE